ncbi:MAG: phosphomannomutase/phosphoglucomutase [Gammaproteobacteria bacterium]|nr:phosphomannomutase/phosphoglucomutase [Gammaproteobacteria bacterium]
MNLSPDIFRAYDIRGVVGQDLTVDAVREIGKALGLSGAETGSTTFVVGRDGRLSGPELIDALAEGLLSAGCDVIDIGMVATPLVYFATHELGTGTGVAVTGSHNPPDYNGLKMMIGGETLSGEAIQGLRQRIAAGIDTTGILRGQLSQQSVDDRYVDRIAQDIHLSRPLKVVADCGNGVGGAITPRVLESIGAEVLPLYCEVDGTFPNHHPDPTDPKNLVDLVALVQESGADLGLGFDGDGDRLGVVTPEGDIVWPDRLLGLFAEDVLSRNPGAPIIFDVKCSRNLRQTIEAAGGEAVMWRTGHSMIKRKMRETAAPLAGEMSGHIFFKERWFGFDDGLYAACRLLEILAQDARSPTEVFAALPDSISTPELKIPMAEGAHFELMKRLQQRADFGDAEVSTLDGLRVDYPGGWGLVRPSNTTPVLVLRFEAESEAELARIQARFRQVLLAEEPTLKLPF